MSWSGRLWAEIEPVYAQILAHPFLGGLADGSLDPAAFGHYLTQDALYLGDFARALAVLAAKAPTHADTAMLSRHAAGTVEVELALHAALLADLGVDPAAATAGPTTRAYTSYLLAAAYGASFAEGLAAVLPCYWIYAQVGTALVRRGSPQPRYQRWIDTYAGPEFEVLVGEVLELTDRIGVALDPGEQARARARVATAARYEWMFWDAAWRQESWPL